MIELEIAKGLAWIAFCIALIVIMWRAREKPYTQKQVEAIEEAHKRSAAIVAATSAGLGRKS